MEKTLWHSYKTGKIAKGCELCVEGRKLVLFITGLCSRKCWYCPVSEQKFGKDVVYANEWKIEDPENPTELFEEVKLTGAKGAGITGGDPLCKIDRCVKYIKLLKIRYGKGFHIHLYTPLDLVTDEKLRQLHDAGLDEIRFHPDLENDELWERIELAKEYNWAIGVEIPAIPGREEQTKKLIDYIADKADFLNLNELERSDTQARHYKLDEKGYKQKDKISYGVKGSEETALKMLEYAQQQGLSAHYCTAKLKDAVQLQKRIKLRAQKTAKPFDTVTEEGLLLRGALYLPGLQPGIDYRKRIELADEEDCQKRLQDLAECIIDEIGTEGLFTDKKRYRIIISAEQAKKDHEKFKRIGLVPAIIEEYPTEDHTIVEVEFL